MAGLPCRTCFPGFKHCDRGDSPPLKSSVIAIDLYFMRGSMRVLQATLKMETKVQTKVDNDIVFFWRLDL